jgi:hypothetical protein
MLTKTFNCDCGCGEEAVSGVAELQNWLTLTHVGPVNSKTDKAKLRRDFHFASFECLARWVNKAIPIIKDLKKSVSVDDVPSPRGAYVHEDLPDVAV